MSIANEELRAMVYDQAGKKKRGRPKSSAAKKQAIRIPSNRETPQCRVVRLSREAVQIIEDLARKTGQEKSKIASAIIEQGSKIIEFYPAMCVGCEYQDQCEYGNGGVCLVEEQEDAE